MTARRRFFRKLATYAALLGGSIIVSSCDKATEKDVTEKNTPADHQQQLLDAFVDTIVPEDQYPGAVEAGVTAQLHERYDKDKKEAKNVFLMLAALERLANKHYKRSFSALKLTQRESVVKQLTHSQDKNDRPLHRTLGQQRSLIIRNFYLSSTGRAMLGYTPPYPGGYPDYNKPPPA